MRARQRPGQRILAIGLDAAEATLIERWSQEGFLPHIKALIEEGTWGRLDSTAEMLSGSVWPSLFTGTLPGKHGMYYPLQTRPGHQGVTGVAAGCDQPPFWKILDEDGKRCLIMDVPFSYPVPDLGGVQIFDWGTYDKCSMPQSVPALMLHDLINRWGHHPLEKTLKEPTRMRDHRGLLQKLLTGVFLKGQVVSRLLASEAWDFFFVVFSETHPAGHYFWHLNHPKDSDSLNGNQDLSTALRETYIAADHAIGQILQAIDSDTTVLVFSGHGMAHNPLGSHLLPEVLQRLGLLVTCGREEKSRKAWEKRNWLKRARDSVPASLRQLVSRHLPIEFQRYLSSRWASADIDWERTRVYCLPTDLQGYLRVNLKGREPRGIVEPGSEYEELCAQVSKKLSGLVDPLDGREIVRRIFKTDETFPGPCRHHLPDLIVCWGDSGINEVYSPVTGLISGRSPDLRSGNHRPEGLFILKGPQIPRGRVLEGAHICDIAPTILASFGLTPPKYMDGKVWNEPMNLPGMTVA